jgi:signal transduction histidine kinase
MDKRTSKLKARLAAAIRNGRAAILERWLERVTADGRVSGVSPTDLRNAMPDYLDKLHDELLRNGITLEESGSSVWVGIAREHALTRVRLGFDISQLVHEFILLRRVLQEVAQEEGAFLGKQEPILAELVEAAIAVAVQTYVEARDYEARRAQAANIGFITHELRSPLNAAMLAASLLRHELSRPEELRLLDTVQRNQGRLRDLIDTVLDSQKLESGTVKSRPVRIRLRHILDELVSSTRQAAEQKGLRFYADFDPDFELEVDPVLTRSAVQNLLENAVKYTDEGEIRLVAEARQGHLVIHVLDTCHGLSREELGTVFEPFTRGHSKAPGTGLGLAIARRAIEVQGGKVECESPGERGCHFWITVPERPSQTAETSAHT